MKRKLYSDMHISVGNLLSDIERGRVGLPDLQRDFVWNNIQIRDLLDSMVRGFPIGYIMLWGAPKRFDKSDFIGEGERECIRPNDLVVDGQQRLTGLLAATRGIQVKGKKIVISYKPLNREFAVWSKSQENDSDWISDISEIFKANDELKIPQFRREYIQRNNEKRVRNERPELTPEEENKIEEGINTLLSLNKYMLPVLRISEDTDEEDVAEIFVRVNSGGQKLSENNFIETLLAVYDNNVRNEIISFCKDATVPGDGTAYNRVLEVKPSSLIKMAVGLGFRRARLRYAYLLLNGKDLETGEISEETRNSNLEVFRTSLEKVINLNTWHVFFNICADAGYLNKSIIGSDNAIIYSYVLYLIGKYDYKIPEVRLKAAIKRWIFMSTITKFYTNSSDSVVEKQFADLRSVNTEDGFIGYIDRTISDRFTDEYFKRTLPNDFRSSSASSPAWFGYLAALNVLNTPMLFSTTSLSHFFIAGAKGKKSSIDKHHIFPKKYLGRIGVDLTREQNQVANFTYLDQAVNVDISDKSPEEYGKELRNKLGDERYKKTCMENAIPEGFETMDYPEFLEKRRVLMAAKVKEAFEKLSAGN